VSSARCLPGRGFSYRQSFFFVTPGNGSYRLRCHAHVPGYLRCRLSLVKLAQNQGPPQHPRRFPPLRQHPCNLLPLLLAQLHMHSMVGCSHRLTMQPIQLLQKCLFRYTMMRSET
jgi:hypothetical protein